MTGRKKRECKRTDKMEVPELEKMGKWLERLLSR
jgi:hypothetical protein